MLKNFWQGLCSLVFPANCMICKKSLLPISPLDLLCPRCLATIEANGPPFCRKCSRHLSNPEKSDFCPDCLRHKHCFDKAWAATGYNESMKQLIHLFKYSNKTSLRTLLASLIVSFVESYNLDLDEYHVIAAVPLHPTRLRERGYNQAQLIADCLSRKFDIRLSIDNLIRTRPTDNQALLGQKERWTNIHNAFKIKNPQAFSKKSVLVVDDLLTTGATASEAARVLKENGARQVGVLTVAIAN